MLGAPFYRLKPDHLDPLAPTAYVVAPIPPLPQTAADSRQQPCGCRNSHRQPCSTAANSRRQPPTAAPNSRAAVGTRRQQPPTAAVDSRAAVGSTAATAAQQPPTAAGQQPQTAARLLAAVCNSRKQPRKTAARLLAVCPSAADSRGQPPSATQQPPTATRLSRLLGSGVGKFSCCSGKASRQVIGGDEVWIENDFYKGLRTRILIDETDCSYANKRKGVGVMAS